MNNALRIQGFCLCSSCQQGRTLRLRVDDDARLSICYGSEADGAVLFKAYLNDHPPPHVHAAYAEVLVIVELFEDAVDLARRPDAVSPNNGSRADIQHVLQVAARHLADLHALWEAHHG